MKTYKPIYLQQLLLAALFWALSSTSMAVENPTLELLKQNYAHQKLTRQLNKATAVALESCLCQKLNCQSTSEIQSFTRKFYNLSGTLTELENSCQQLIEDLLRKPIREKYEQMKIDLALSAPALKDDNILLVEYDPDHSLKMSVRPQHPFFNPKLPFSSKTWIGVPIESLTALESRTELPRALTEFNQSRDTICKSHFLSLPHTDEQKKTNLQLCDKLSKYGFRGVTIEERLLTRDLTYQLKNQRQRFQKRKFQDYMRAVTESPILLMVKSANPSDQELLEVIRAQKNFKSDINLTIEALDKAKTLDAEKLFDLAYQTGRIPDTVMVLTKKKYPEIKNWDQIKIELENNFAEKAHNAMVGKFILNASIIAACTLATGNTLTTACASTLVALSLGQLLMDFNSYQSTLLDLAASVDRDATAENLNEEKLADQMMDMRIDTLAAVLMIAPAIKHMPRKNLKNIIQGIL